MKQLVLAVILVGMIFSQETRIFTMGGLNDAIRDFSNIHQYATSVLNFKNLSTLDFTTPQNYSTYFYGMHYKLNDATAIGIYLNRMPSLSTFGHNDLGSPLTFDKQSEIYFGMDMNDMKVAGAINLTMDNGESNTGSGSNIVKNISTLYNYGIRGAAEMMNFEADIRLNLMSSKTWSESSDGTTKKDATLKDWSGTGFGLNFRYKMELDSKTDFFGILKFYSQSNDLKDNNNTNITTDYSFTGLRFIGAVNHKIDENNLMILAVEPFSLNKVSKTSENKTTNTTDEMNSSQNFLPAFYAGVESRITSWLVGRIGVNQIFTTSTSEIIHTDKTNSANNSSNETITYGSNFTANFGVSVQLGNFRCDAVFNEGLLERGPNFISGNAEPLSSRVSVTYEF